MKQAWDTCGGRPQRQLSHRPAAQLIDRPNCPSAPPIPPRQHHHELRELAGLHFELKRLTRKRCWNKATACPGNAQHAGAGPPATRLPPAAVPACNVPCPLLLPARLRCPAAVCRPPVAPAGRLGLEHAACLAASAFMARSATTSRTASASATRRGRLGAGCPPPTAPTTSCTPVRAGGRRTRVACALGAHGGRRSERARRRQRPPHQRPAPTRGTSITPDARTRRRCPQAATSRSG